MGIQSRKNTAKRNNVTVNINIEEKPRHVRVIKQLKAVIVRQPKPVVVKQPKAVVKAPYKTDKSPDKVGELKENANTFQSLRDEALSKNIKLPSNFSAIPDIRDKKIWQWLTRPY